MLGELSGSGYREPPALARRSGGHTLQLTRVPYELLRAIAGERDHDERASVLSEQIGKHATADDVRFLIDNKLRPLGLLQLPDASASAVRRRARCSRCG